MNTGIKEKDIVRKEKCSFRALSLPMGVQESSGYCAQVFQGGQRRMSVVRCRNIYSQKYSRTFSHTTKTFLSQNGMLRHYTLFDTLNIPVQRNPRYGDGIGGIWTENTFGIFILKNLHMYVQTSKYLPSCRRCAECTLPGLPAPLHVCAEGGGWDLGLLFRSSRDWLVLPY